MTNNEKLIDKAKKLLAEGTMALYIKKDELKNEETMQVVAKLSTALFGLAYRFTEFHKLDAKERAAFIEMWLSMCDESAKKTLK